MTTLERVMNIHNHKYFFSFSFLFNHRGDRFKYNNSFVYRDSFSL